MADNAVTPFEKSIVTEAGLLEIQNSLDTFMGIIGNQYGNGQPSQQISQTGTLYINLRWYLISNNRQLLSQAYAEHGLIQTLIDQPVDDGFRAGFEIKSSQLSPEDITDLEVFAQETESIRAVMQSAKWARLYGGGALIVITAEDPATPLNLNKLKEGAPFRLKSVDMWELYNTIMNVTADVDLNLDDQVEYFDYYGIKVHCSRVMIIKGKEEPSFIKPRLRGWGMSEVERMIRSINQYLKNQDVVFELLDEAKVDVYKMKGFNTALLAEGGTQKVAKRTQMANQMKNFQSALTMDSEDEYEQKQITFSGLAEILTQIRQGVAADVKMPMTKLFGISAAGFSSGEDDIENYNSMIEGEVRNKTKFIVTQVLKICCAVRFGFVPDDLQIEWKSLRILSAKEEEEVKDFQFNRLMTAFTSGLATAQETKQGINKADLLPVQLDETTAALPALAGFGSEGDEEGDDESKTEGGARDAKQAPEGGPKSKKPQA